MITAETITDEQIRELATGLRTELVRMPPAAWVEPLESGLRACSIALSGPALGGESEHEVEWTAARERCAEILNARGDK